MSRLPTSTRPARRLRAAIVAGVAVLALAGCTATQTTVRGYVVTEDQLVQVPVGSSREQVLFVLGTPSTTGTLQTGNEVFYYISQRLEAPAKFMAERVVDQRVLTVYFDRNGQVEQIAEYGLLDGKVFDFIQRKTPSAGRDLDFISQVLEGLVSGGNPISPGG